uniref:Uncharacterized protein n=1 Tax=Cyanothece sp. (strain PCC 7425 / ATCC 29141) TaxID=395961 RepID=B8HVZ3_CYAP4
MAMAQVHYEEMLSYYSNHLHALELLRQHRPYMETVPSVRRSEESLITIPLPIVQLRRDQGDSRRTGYEKVCLPCDIAFLMCDPEWQVKTDVEVFVFIHRLEEDFSNLLQRWRQTQVLLSQGYSWEMPPQYQHIFSEGADKNLPLFVLFEQTPERIKRGMAGAGLPFIIAALPLETDTRLDSLSIAPMESSESEY